MVRCNEQPGGYFRHPLNNCDGQDFGKGEGSCRGAEQNQAAELIDPVEYNLSSEGKCIWAPDLQLFLSCNSEITSL